MNRGLNLPGIQKIMNEFEKESSMMDMKEEMMSDAVDDVMDDDLEDEEEEGDAILKQVLDEIGVDLDHQVGYLCGGKRQHVTIVYSSKRRPLVLLCPKLHLQAEHRLRLERPLEPRRVLQTTKQVVIVLEEACLMRMRYKRDWTR